MYIRGTLESNNHKINIVLFLSFFNTFFVFFRSPPTFVVIFFLCFVFVFCVGVKVSAIFAEYAGILASEGETTTALKYIKGQGHDGAVLMDRYVRIIALH